jgi:predicted small lipoprotein YifL
MKKSLLLLLVLMTASCGIKGPPLPPLDTMNDRTNNANIDGNKTAASAESTDATTVKPKTK